ncbi:PQQ-dependent sugar dehydrogenase [Catenovulum sediminis]|uniref:PQQ-dependent sugar dehydrogenase n=1 Tax=Catenovulum sediminis TaxID=1740262 RepID=A0ABV1RGS4_9ALTE|nr:PQQ-dependent sugar dehydrogenase [Catenovulum sediminis]
MKNRKIKNQVFTALSLLLCSQSNVFANVNENYSRYCASCHGDKLQGGLGPNLKDDTWLHGSSEQAIFSAIENGVLAKGMPAWKGTLSSEEIRAMVVYLQERAVDAADSEGHDRVDNKIFKTEDYKVELQSFAVLENSVWAISFLPDGSLLTTEKNGHLFIIDKNGTKTQIKNTPNVWLNGQGGLLDVAAHPEYPKQPWIYLSYADNSFDKDIGMTKIVRGQIIDGTWQKEQVIFSAEQTQHTSAAVHFGSRFALHNGYVYFSVGDRGKKELAQSLANVNGKIYRLYYDGRVPQDNPFAKQKSAVSAIWSYGHRNPQGLAIHPVTGKVWSTEHGPRGGDEINLVEKGLNYGWPVITYGINYNGTPITDKTHQDGMQQPKHYWVPSIATGGIDFYKGSQFGLWQNNLLVTGMKSEELRRIVIEGTEVTQQEVIFQGRGRVRDVAVSPSGEIYVAINTGEPKSGQIFRLNRLK